MNRDWVTKKQTGSFVVEKSKLRCHNDIKKSLGYLKPTWDPPATIKTTDAVHYQGTEKVPTGYDQWYTNSMKLPIRCKAMICIQVDPTGKKTKRDMKANKFLFVWECAGAAGHAGSQHATRELLRAATNRDWLIKARQPQFRLETRIQFPTCTETLGHYKNISPIHSIVFCMPECPGVVIVAVGDIHFVRFIFARC
jgi:hypothetical protein